MGIKDIKIDKMTILGDLPKKYESSFQLLLDNSLDVEISNAFVSRVNGTFFGYTGNPIYFDYDGVNSLALKKRNFRLEFNPTKISEEHKMFLRKKVIPFLGNVGFSRIDLAVDVDNKLSDYDFEIFNKSKTYVYAKDGQLATQYIGSRKSKVMLRIYDKKRQLLEVENMEIPDDVLWRFEIEIKGKSVIEDLIANGFDSLIDFRIISYDFENVSPTDECFIQAMYLAPGSFKKLSKPTRAKIRKIAKACSGDDLAVMMKNEIKKNNPLILEELESYTRYGRRFIF